MLKDIVEVVPDQNLVRIRLATRKPTASERDDPAYRKPKARHEDFIFSHALPYRRSAHTPAGVTQAQVRCSCLLFASLFLFLLFVLTLLFFFFPPSFSSSSCHPSL